MFDYIIKTIILRFLMGISIIALLYSLNKILDKYYKSLEKDLIKIKSLRQNLLLYGTSSYYENKLLALSKKQFLTLSYKYLESLGFQNITKEDSKFYDYKCSKNKEIYLIKCIPYDADATNFSFSSIYKLVGLMLKNKNFNGVVLTPYDIKDHWDVITRVDTLNLIVEDKNILINNLLKKNFEI